VIEKMSMMKICEKEKELCMDFGFEMFRKLVEKYPEYGHSWETCSVGFLINKLHIEMKEFNQTPFTDYKKIQGELIDVSNLCAMIWKRLEQNKGW
jgi:hypothetical protein